ncbi:MAG TPA: helix-turn-helix transcriptional regulator [Alphaproteobacteria bacterium]|nr:helix-turn-helix transcriptional regulator [Alphaproteobacteria bacterium]
MASEALEALTVTLPNGRSQTLALPALWSPASLEAALRPLAERARQCAEHVRREGVMDGEAAETALAGGLRDGLVAAIDIVAALIAQHLVQAYQAHAPAAAGRRRAAPSWDKALEQGRGMARTLFSEEAYVRKLARWIYVNVSAWALDRSGDAVPLSGAALACLINVYAEESAQTLSRLMSPPERPLEDLEAMLGIRALPGGAPPKVPEIPKGTLVVLSSGHFQGLREALYKNTFQKVEGSPWPTAPLDKGGARGYAQLRPAIMDSEPLLPAEQMEAWTQTMWRQQQELSDLDADALDALCAIYLSQARDSDDAAIADVDEILAMRGLKPKRGGQGRRGGYEPEQRAEMLRALSHIQNLWIDIAEVKVYEKDAKGRQAKQPTTKTLQSRPFLITDRMGQIRLDGYMDVERFIFRPGKAFAAFLFGSGRQTGLLFQKALQYDPLRRKWEKRLTRYISWHWRAVARSGEFAQTYRVRTLLDAVGEGLNPRYPSKTRQRLEKALDTLAEDRVVAGWQYARWDETLTEGRGWGEQWLNTTVVIEAPDAIKDFYSRLAHHAEAAPAAGVALVGRGEAADDVGERVKRRRMARNLSQLQVSEQLGIQQGYLSKLERGKAVPSPKLRRQIEAWLVD